MIRIPFAAILSAASLLTILAVTGARAAEPPDPDSAFGQALIQVEQRFDPPPMPILLEDGAEASLRGREGEVTVAVFWATWCGVCLGEMPQLDALQAELGAEGVTVLPVSVDEGEGALGKVGDYLERRELGNLAPMIDYGRLNFQLFGARGTPTAFILDKSGQVAAAIEGPAYWDSPEAKANLLSLVAEPTVRRHFAE